MKICFVVSHPKDGIGGSELQVYLLAKELLGHGEEIHFAFEASSEKIERYGICEIDEGIAIHRIKRKKIFRVLNFWRLYSLLKEIDADIYYNTVLSEYTGITAYFSRKNNKKFIWACASDSDCYEGFNFNKAKKNKNNILKRFILLAYARFNDRLCSYGIKNANQIIALTRHQQNLLKKKFNRDSTVNPVGHPVPSQPFKKTYPPIIVWVASIKKLKQPEIFIKLAEECQDLNTQFVYCGRPAEREYQRMLMDRTNKLPNLKYLGKISFDQLYKLLASASILVNTSIYEGFPVTYIEAWMRETPVITLNCDPDDIIKNKKIGFHSQSFEQLVKDVRYLIENENIRKEMGKKAREYAVEKHDFEKIGKRYLEVFNKLIEE